MSTPPPITAPAAGPKRSGLNTGCLIALVILGAGALLLILVGSVVFFPVYGKVVEQAKVVQTRNVLAQARLATLSFAMEYQKFPEADPSGPALLEGALLEAMTGTASPANPRGITFLSLPPAQESRAGLSAGPPPALIDSWGTPVLILLDTVMAGSLPDPEHPGSSVAESVLLWSAGPDGDFTTWADNVKSWGP